MQVPEKLSLIGGSILLASTLVFTLKSQASSIIPNVSHSISGVFDHIGDAQKNSDFDSNFREAQKNGWTTGTWGTAPYYINKDNDLHIGKGKANNVLYSVIGDNNMDKLRSINFDQPVQAPSNSIDLLAGKMGSVNPDTANQSLESINGLDNLDTSHTTNITGMFANYAKLTNLDVSSLNVSNVTGMNSLFVSDFSLNNISGINNWQTDSLQDSSWAFAGTSLRDLNLNHWNTTNINNMTSMFGNNNNSLQSLDISSFNTSRADTNNLFGGNYAYISNNLRKITLGDKSYLKNTQFASNDNWKQGSTSLSVSQLTDGSAHDGTWIKQ